MTKKRKRERSLAHESEGEKKAKKSKRRKEKKHTRRRSPSSSSSASSSSPSSSEDRKLRKKKKKDKKKKKSKLREKETADSETGIGPAVPSNLPKPEEERPRMAPMTKEEWEKKQSVVRRVFDEPSGRWRLIKGDGEVLEEIVSRERHKEINRQATKGDGAYFQAKLPKR